VAGGRLLARAAVAVGSFVRLHPGDSMAVHNCLPRRTLWWRRRIQDAAPPQPLSTSVPLVDSAEAPAVSSSACPFAIDVSRHIGAGTSGKVYQVDNAFDRRSYCVKVLPLDGEKGEEARVVAFNEAELHASLTHQNIVRYCYSWIAPSPDGGGGPSFHLLMELCRTDLWSCVETALETASDFAAGAAAAAAAAPPGMLDRGMRWRFSRQLATALSYMHTQSVLHRDLNPWNVFISHDGDAKVGDFGLSVRHRAHSAPLAGWETPGAAPLDASAIGSLYSAPELGSASYGYSADAFSLGMLLLLLWTPARSTDEAVASMEALKDTGKPPDGVHDGSAPLGSLVLRLASRQCDARPTASDAAAEIERLEAVDATLSC
jgi:serine/threonine protein kinase